MSMLTGDEAKHGPESTMRVISQTPTARAPAPHFLRSNFWDQTYVAGSVTGGKHHLIEHRELTSRLCHISKKSGSKRIDLSNRSVHPAGAHLQNEIVQMQGCEDTVSEVMRSDDLCEQKEVSSGRIKLDQIIQSLCAFRRTTLAEGNCADAELRRSSVRQISASTSVSISYNGTLIH